MLAHEVLSANEVPGSARPTRVATARLRDCR